MIILTKKMSIRGGPLYLPGETYQGPWEEWAIKQGIGLRMQDGGAFDMKDEKKNEDEKKVIDCPPMNKMVQEDQPNKKKGRRW